VYICLPDTTTTTTVTLTYTRCTTYVEGLGRVLDEVLAQVLHKHAALDVVAELCTDTSHIATHGSTAGCGAGRHTEVLGGRLQQVKDLVVVYLQVDRSNERVS
jgi:hypothetical protein